MTIGHDLPTPQRTPSKAARVPCDPSPEIDCPYPTAIMRASPADKFGPADSSLPILAVFELREPVVGCRSVRRTVSRSPLRDLTQVPKPAMARVGKATRTSARTTAPCSRPPPPAAPKAASRARAWPCEYFRAGAWSAPVWSARPSRRVIPAPASPAAALPASPPSAGRASPRPPLPPPSRPAPAAARRLAPKSWRSSCRTSTSASIDSIVEYPARLAQGAQAADRQRAGQVPAQAPRPRQGRPVQGRVLPRDAALPRQQAVPAAAPDRHEARTTTRCSSGATASTSCSSTSPARATRRRWKRRSTAGRVLALYHKLLQDFQSRVAAAGGSYHMAAGGRDRVCSRSREPAAGAADADSGAACSNSCSRATATPPRRSSSWGWTSWPKQIVHADWHPGNMLFRDNHVVAVIDYDSARHAAARSSTSPTAACSSRSSAATRTSRNGRSTSTRAASSGSCAAMMR